MLLDRACVRGGWNAGNSVVFGVPLEPQPDFTAMALLALRSSVYDNQPLVNRSLDYLADRFELSRPPYSLAWASMALSAHHHPSASNLKARLEAATKVNLSELPVRTLALVALALEEPTFTFWEGAS